MVINVPKGITEDHTKFLTRELKNYIEFEVQNVKCSRGCLIYLTINVPLSYK